jgi:hypothetical protein
MSVISLLEKLGEKELLATAQKYKPSITSVAEISEPLAEAIEKLSVGKTPSVASSASGDAASSDWAKAGKAAAVGAPLGLAAILAQPSGKKPPLAKPLPSVETTNAVLSAAPAAPTLPPSNPTPPPNSPVFNFKRKAYDEKNSPYTEEMRAYKGGLIKAGEQLQGEKDLNSWGRIASLIGEGLTKYGAAEAMGKKGVYAPLDIKTPDWAEMLKESERGYERKERELGSNASLAEKLDAAKRKEHDRAEEDKKDVALAKYKADFEKAQLADKRAFEEKELNKRLEVAKDIAKMRGDSVASSAEQKALNKEQAEKEKDMEALRGAIARTFNGKTDKDKMAAALYVEQFGPRLGMSKEDMDALKKASINHGMFNVLAPNDSTQLNKQSEILSRYSPSKASSAPGASSPLGTSSPLGASPSSSDMIRIRFNGRDYMVRGDDPSIINDLASGRATLVK